MSNDIDSYINSLHSLANSPYFHHLTEMNIISINAGISALMIIRDGNYQFEANNNTLAYHKGDITKDEVIATLRALANIIEKGEI